MRIILRSAARLARALAWLLKAALLLAALGVGVLWPMSRGQILQLDLGRMTAHPDRVDELHLLGACDNGWIVGGYLRTDNTGGDDLAAARVQAADRGDAWSFERWSRESDSVLLSLPATWGPFRGSFSTVKEPTVAFEDRFVSAPCWLVAPALAAWPLASVALLLRRRVRRDRRGRLGLCDQCGYDLRAGAARDGTLLERCPECGAATPGGGGSIADAQRDGR